MTVDMTVDMTNDMTLPRNSVRNHTPSETAGELSQAQNRNVHEDGFPMATLCIIDIFVSLGAAGPIALIAIPCFATITYRVALIRYLKQCLLSHLGTEHDTFEEPYEAECPYHRRTNLANCSHCNPEIPYSEHEPAIPRSGRGFGWAYRRPRRVANNQEQPLTEEQRKKTFLRNVELRNDQEDTLIAAKWDDVPGAKIMDDWEALQKR